MDIGKITLADVQDLIWALGYAQPCVDTGHDRPATAEDLARDKTWGDDYRRFWFITQRFGMTFGIKQ